MLGDLVPDIRRTAGLVAEISIASRELSAGSGQINQSIQQLDRVTQSTTSASEEMAASSAELSTQADTLSEAMSFFKLSEMGADPLPAARSDAEQPAVALRQRPIVTTPTESVPAAKAAMRDIPPQRKVA
jgi:methyl-accepting chemotaxis protein